MVKLAVGGRLFETSYATLCAKEPNSVLAALFSNPSKLQRNNAGEVILDVDPDAFELVLVWLRVGVLPRNLSTERTDNLHALATVLRLESLANAVRDPKRDQNRPALVTVVHNYYPGTRADECPSEVTPPRVQELLLKNYQLVGTDVTVDNHGRRMILYHLVEK